MTCSECDVLIVDDDAVVRSAAERVLSEAGLPVSSAASVADALEHPDRARCRVVLCDLKLPDGSGLEVLRHLRAERPDLPFVITTGYATPATLARAADAGATILLPKPFDEEELLAAVREAFSSAPGKEKKP
jgi:DNA-binding NtrC family response regulator